uniref:PDEase domain-containing protein n=1 Tax=Globisporangium ultimum (strain ATCC 200006 / CBS 805.95 / DAOM BR144) TaxID=431595 RepID=K3WMW0_GLOUD
MSNDQSDSSAGIIVTKDEVDQILAGFAKALESSASSRGQIEDEMQQLFLSHANVFDEDMQNFFIQNFIHEAECAKTFRTTVRRTSLVRRCLLAMYPAEKSRCTTEPSRWNASLVARAVQHCRSNSLEVCPEVDNPIIIEAVKSEIAKLCDWDFNVFVIADAVPGQTLSIVGNALLEKYEFCCHFRSSKAKMHHFLRQIELKYHNHPYHNAVHAADVAQSIHHLLTPAGLGESFSPRTKCAAILAAIVHDVGHTSYSNNFHISVNDDLAIQYVYRSPLEHMHCAVAFQLLRNPKCNILQGLTKIEQLEMALHAADVSNPAKSTAMCKIWAERIMQEFYQQGDKERKLQLPVSFGCDRENPIPLEKMQAGFIIGIVRPLFNAICQLPKVELSQCMKRLDENLLYWQSELAGNPARNRED